MERNTKMIAMKKICRLYTAAALLMLVSLTGCVKDLDQQPYVQETSASVYAKAENYKKVMAKVYASLAIGGQEKGDGNPDLSGRAANSYLRIYFNMQELPTDEVVYTWGGGDALNPLQFITWNTTDEWSAAMYYRILYTVGLCNEYLRNAKDAQISKFTPAEVADIQGQRNDVRFIRALAWSHAIDLFGIPPFVTEDDPVGAFFPKQTTRSDLFNYIEKELKELAAALPDRAQAEAGRANKGAAYALLAKLYLNAEVYTGTGKYTECIEAAKNAIAQGYSLEPTYSKLFNADNDKRSNEIIFAIQQDGLNTTTWGGTTYLVCGPIVGSMAATDYGVQSGWSSIRTTPQFVSLFPDVTGATDKRARFHTDGQSLDINDPTLQTDGYGLTKFTNKTDAGGNGSNFAEGLVDTDFPVLRLADVYLMYAEAVLRGGTGGSTVTALDYVNQIRTRAYNGSNAGNISQADLTLNFILAERGRELFWECTRRTDLVRYGRFTGNTYLWQWKGGVKAGTTVHARYNVFPIPATDRAANPNLQQNKDY